MSSYELRVTGMTCASCATHVEQALKATPGVDEVNVAYPESIARIDGRGPEAVRADVQEGREAALLLRGMNDAEKR